MKIYKDIDLRPYNTFGIHAVAKCLIEIENGGELEQVLPEYPSALILGGGSNVLLLNGHIECVIHIAHRGIEVIDKDNRHVWVRVQAGEPWNDFVQWALEHDFGGVENLALIPGSTGAAPVQNIGAYGREVKEVIERVEAIERQTGKPEIFTPEQCGFGYRDSIFKSSLKGHYVIRSVVFRLNLPPHRISTSYGSISQWLQRRGIEKPGIKDVANAVMDIRRSKLPDPGVAGNAGSFFKNPIVSREQFEQLHRKYPEIPHYPATEKGSVKLAAGWLIDQCGLKGYRMGNAAVHDRQALVLVNTGNASGKDIAGLAQFIVETVYQHFGIRLEREVNYVGSAEKS